MSRRVEGGPADGIEVGDGGSVRWIDPVREMGYAEPAAGRWPYRLAGGVYVPAALCPICGSILDADEQGIRPDPCPLCGFDRWKARNGGSSAHDRDTAGSDTAAECSRSRRAPSRRAGG